jgi:hypothetical protein
MKFRARRFWRSTLSPLVTLRVQLMMGKGPWNDFHPAGFGSAAGFGERSPMRTSSAPGPHEAER